MKYFLTKQPLFCPSRESYTNYDKKKHCINKIFSHNNLLIKIGRSDI